MYCISQRELLNLRVYYWSVGKTLIEVALQIHFFHALRKQLCDIFFSVAFKVNDENILASLKAIANFNKSE